MEGRTKRWTFFFKGSLRYCSTSYLSDGSTIRPKGEILSRLACTPSPILTVWDWRRTVTQYLVEFHSNPSARAEMLSMWVDSFYMERENIIAREDAVNNLGALGSGAISYPSMEYIRMNHGRRAPYVKGSGRGWWLAQADWYPDLSDVRLRWIRKEIESLYRVIALVHGTDELRAVDLFRLRMVQTRRRSPGGWAPGLSSFKTVRKLRDAYNAICRGESLVGSYTPVSWTPTYEHISTAIDLLHKGELIAGRYARPARRRRLTLQCQSFVFKPGTFPGLGVFDVSVLI